MTVATVYNNGTCCLGIDGEMTIYSAAELKGALLDGLNRCAQLEINLSQVSEMDSAGLQLLYLVKREAAHLNRNVSLVAHSPATLEVLDLYSMTSHFGDPVLISEERQKKRSRVKRGGAK
jgi:anti-sigma B factor antagonist